MSAQQTHEWSQARFETLPEMDQQVQQFMNQIDATAATIAITHRGKLLYSRGYGHSDRRQRVATRPNTIMRIASCTKPFTAAMVYQLIDSGKISRDTRVLEYLNVRGSDQPADPRFSIVTVGHLLDHKGGWDQNVTFDPMYEMDRIKRDLGIRKVKKLALLRFMLKQPLQADPGTIRHYSNFGYLLLGMVIEKATGKSYVQSIRQLFAESIDPDDLTISTPRKSTRKRREVFYPVENNLNFQIRDSASGLATDSLTLCRFMNQYWINGKPKDNRRRFRFQMGSHPATTTAIMEQRLDRIHYALIMNSRRDEHYQEDNEELRRRLNLTIDALHEKLTSE